MSSPSPSGIPPQVVRVVGQTSPSFHINDIGVTVPYGSEVRVPSSQAQVSSDLWAAVKSRKILHIPSPGPKALPVPLGSGSVGASPSPPPETPSNPSPSAAHLIVSELQTQNQLLRELLAISQAQLQAVSALLAQRVPVGVYSPGPPVPPFASPPGVSSPEPLDSPETPIFVPSFTGLRGTPSSDLVVKEEVSADSSLALASQKLRERLGKNHQSPEKLPGSGAYQECSPWKRRYSP